MKVFLPFDESVPRVREVSRAKLVPYRREFVGDVTSYTTQDRLGPRASSKHDKSYGWRNVTVGDAISG